MEVFLDLDPTRYTESDQIVGSHLISKLKKITPSIGKRIKKIQQIGMSYDSPSVAMFEQAKELYCLGYFLSSVIVSRSTAEYLAFEIFLEEIDIIGKEELIEHLAENLDFRKIVNEFLYNTKIGLHIIDKDSHDAFNKIYSTSNQWVHPHRPSKKVDIEMVAYESVKTLSTLLSSLRDVMKDYDVSSRGVLVRKATARKKIRPISLAQ